MSVAGVGRVADHETLGQFDEAVDELVEDRALDIEAAAGQADLAGVGEGGLDGPLERSVEVGVGEDQVLRSCRPVRSSTRLRLGAPA